MKQLAYETNRQDQCQDLCWSRWLGGGQGGGVGLIIRFDDVSERGGIGEYENEKDMIL